MIRCGRKSQTGKVSRVNLVTEGTSNNKESTHTVSWNVMIKWTIEMSLYWRWFSSKNFISVTPVSSWFAHFCSAFKHLNLQLLRLGKEIPQRSSNLVNNLMFSPKNPSYKVLQLSRGVPALQLHLWPKVQHQHPEFTRCRDVNVGDYCV